MYSLYAIIWQLVACVNSGYSKDSLVMHLLWALWFVSAKFCFEVHAVHIPGQLNQAADALSRGNRSSFFSILPEAKPVETQIPSAWVDMLLVQKCDWTSPDWTQWLKTSS